MLALNKKSSLSRFNKLNLKRKEQRLSLIKFYCLSIVRNLIEYNY